MPNAMAFELAAQIRDLYARRLEVVVRQGRDLVGPIPRSRRGLPRIVFISLIQRLFLLLRDTARVFGEDIETGYHSTATLTRSLMETATTVLILEKDGYGPMLAAFVRSEREDLGRQRVGFEGLLQSKNAEIAAAAKREMERLATNMERIGQMAAALPPSPSPSRFPTMKARCEALDDMWRFMYYATYRELSGEVHASFGKIPHSPALSFRAPSQGAALLFEHCRAMGYAVEFWGQTVIALAVHQPDREAAMRFYEEWAALVQEADHLIQQIAALVPAHSIVF